jgi:uncharacterized membrane protein YraQ (UPF0718 family)
LKLSRDIISFLVLLALGLAGVFYAQGLEGVKTGVMNGLHLLVEILPIILAAVVIGGYFQSLVPRERVAAMLGDGSGIKGLAIATAAGALTPGGPFASFPLVVALFEAGAGYGAAVAYLTAWTGISLQRAIIWEWPLLGAEITIVRNLVSIPLPIIAGLIARAIAKRFLEDAPDLEKLKRGKTPEKSEGGAP